MVEKIFVFYPYPVLQKRGTYEMCKAILISEVIINRCIDDNYPLNTSKLQKILYFMQKEHLKKYNEPIFNEQILAWPCGPAIKEIEQHFQLGRLGFYEKVEQNTILLETHQDVFEIVLNKYGSMEPIEVMKISQSEECWKEVWNNGLGENNEISIDLITKIDEKEQFDE